MVLSISTTDLADEQVYSQLSEQTDQQLDTLENHLYWLFWRIPNVNLSAELTVLTASWDAFIDNVVVPAMQSRHTQVITFIHTRIQDAVSHATQEEGKIASIPIIDQRMSDVIAADIRAHLRVFAARLNDKLTALLLGQKPTEELLSEVRTIVVGERERTQDTVADVFHTVSERAAHAQMQASGLESSKEWITRGDSRVRPAHVDVNHTVVPTPGHFIVDGFSMDGPHDPLAPIALTINCRCHLRYSISDDVLRTAIKAADLTASAANHDGAMIALIPCDADLARITLPDGEPQEELHLTVLFLGESDGLPKDAVARLYASISNEIEMLQNSGESSVDLSVHANGFGIAHWNPSGSSPAWVMNVGENLLDVGVLRLTDYWQLVVDAVISALEGTQSRIPVQHMPWSPHICLTYADQSAADRLIEMCDRLGPVEFDRLRIAVGSTVHDIPLRRYVD